MKLVYVGQPYDRLFPPVQNSIGLIVYNTALRLGEGLQITLYGKHYRDDTVPADLPFAVRRAAVRRDRALQRIIHQFPRLARWLRLDRKADDHSQYRNKVRRYLAVDQPDIVHLMNYWAWCRELKAASSSHRLVLEMQCEWLSQRDRDQVARQLKVVDAVVAVSDHIASTFRSAFPDYPGVVATVGNGVDVSYFRPSEQRASASTRTRHVILFVGRVSPEKGLHTLIEAFSEVATRFADVELRIAGPHSPLPADFLTSLSSDPRVTALSRFYDRWGNCKYREHLEELIESHGLRDRVHFVGNVPHKDLVATYHEADIVVNPSLSESFGISVVEGMACGIPVVGTRVGGMCESILAGSTGMLVEVDAPGELAQALITMLEDTVRASEMGNEGRKRAVELYSWEARAERLKSVYQKLRPGTRVHVSTKIVSH
ncbi:glycosyltransferase family 4 protein [Mesorhizobium sp.]|uniref:glycosyltransferase family 4 protein n=2 Tax=Mesorhizobium sp. TaxID=1871066 RepID=UPI0011FFE08A|nr:glycosyltransferase family 4 protein [Mesorhizobium sp.]TIM10724.1 MAG: glycosyltransferase family 4 protein [Mesorhizobium sp.]